MWVLYLNQVNPLDLDGVGSVRESKLSSILLLKCFSLPQFIFCSLNRFDVVVVIVVVCV